MLSGSVLVLNRSYVPIQVTTVKRALSLLVLDAARAVDSDYSLYDFASWAELSEACHREDPTEDVIRMVHGLLKVPRVILLTTYNRQPRLNVRFCRNNIFQRDHNTCQYCGRKLPRTQLNLDHVIPRSRGGKTNWENIVCSCLRCNRIKGGRTPREASMQLRQQPRKPDWRNFFMQNLHHIRYQEWNPFLTLPDASYWNVDLEQD